METRKMITWQPVLDRMLVKQAHVVVNEIDEALRGQIVEDPCLATGQAGLALFHTYLFRGFPAGSHDEHAMTALERAIQTVGQQDPGIRLFDGVPGVAWVAEHLKGRLLDPGGDDPNVAVDEVLQQALDAGPWAGVYDLGDGLIGVGVYALERLPLPAAVKLVEKVVERLGEMAQVADGKAVWWTSPVWMPSAARETFPKGYYDLGVAHGLPGVISFLGRVCRAGIAVDKARPLLDGAVAWLLDHKLPEGQKSIFPFAVVPDREAEPSRAAWCYGDPGVAVTLLAAARAVGNADWEKEAMAVAHRAAQRTPEDGLVVDAGLYFGAAGLAHIFNRLFHATSDEEMKGAARTWFRQVLEMRKPGEGIAGYQALEPTPSGWEWRDRPGILVGAAGIGLALLGAITPIEPEWDRVLLTTIDPR